MDDAWRLVPFEHFEQLCPAVGFERSPRVVGKERRAGSLDQAVPLISITTWARTIGDLPEPTAASTPVRVCLPRALIPQPSTLGDTTHLPVPGHPMQGSWSQSVCGPLIAQVLLHCGSVNRLRKEGMSSQMSGVGDDRPFPSALVRFATGTSSAQAWPVSGPPRRPIARWPIPGVVHSSTCGDPAGC
jgi:hypothetical protein